MKARFARSFLAFVSAFAGASMPGRASSFTDAPDAPQRDAIDVGCAVMTHDCLTNPDGTQQCSWGADAGRVLTISIHKTGSAPDYEIWEGSTEGSTRGHHFKVSAYQRRDPGTKTNYLTIDLDVGQGLVSGVGQKTAAVRYLSKADNSGIGIHCDTDLVPGNGTLR